MFGRYLLACLALAGMVAATPLSPQAQTAAGKDARPGVEAFARDPYMSPPQISPDGKAIAWVEGNRVIVHDMTDNSEKAQDGGNNQLDSLQWVGNNYLVVYLKDEDIAKSYYLKTVSYSPIVIGRDAHYVRLLFAHDGSHATTADLWPIVSYVDAPTPYAVVMQDDFTGTIDIATGQRRSGEHLLSGSLHGFDHLGRERMSAEVLDGKVSYGMIAVALQYRAQPGGATQSLRLPRQDDTYYINIHYSEYDNSIYWSEYNYKSGVCSIYRFDIATGQKTLYRTGPNKEMDIAFDTFGHIVGVTTETDRIHTEWTDPYYLKMIKAVEAFFPKALVDIADITEDRQSIVFVISAPEAPPSYYFYSARTKDLVRIGGAYPELDNQTLAPMTYITYKARDGLDIPAYVTKRADTPAHAPLIVMPHGGPAARDTYDFDAWAQFFASKGYVVLQPQYRGSAGFSDAFERAGDGHLAQMTTDLEDGVHYLEAQGAVDPKKICVVGWSWGGYLAQAALAFTPQTYACGVSGAGISNLSDSMEDDNDIWWGGYSSAYWHEVMGSDNAAIHAASPIDHIDAIRAPLLLIHGKLDETVDVRQSQRMNAAMKAAGKDVTYIEIPDMQHSPVRAEQTLIVLKAMDAFVARAFATADKAH